MEFSQLKFLVSRGDYHQNFSYMYDYKGPLFFHNKAITNV